jgi:hypothetical protein
MGIPENDFMMTKSKSQEKKGRRRGGVNALSQMS